MTYVSFSGSLPCYNPALRLSKPQVPYMKYDYRDYALRVLFLAAGGVAAVVLALKGHGEALPGVALGGALGAFFAARVGPREE